jgi:Sulfotransferase family
MDSGTGDVRVVYLGGLGRSGSTLAERLLGELPGACPAGELVHIWQRAIAGGERCGCGEPFPDCPFWQKVGSTAFDGWDKVDTERVAALRGTVDRSRFIPLLSAPALQRPSFARALDTYLTYYRRVYAAIAEVSGCQAVVDSSKHASLAFCLRQCPGIDLRVIHIVRDSRAVAYSWTRQVERPEGSGRRRMRTHVPSSSALSWNTQNSALQLLARTGTQTLLVRYEDLANDPGETLRRMAAFAGLPTGATALRFLGGDGTGRWADLSAGHTVSGNPMRFTTGRIAIRPDETWRTQLPAPHRGAVTALTFPLLAYYGYVRTSR